MILRGRVDRRSDGFFDVDERDVATRERGVIDVAVPVARVDHAVRPGAPRRGQDAHLSVRSDVSVVARLTCEPEQPEAIERSGVEIHVRSGQRIACELVRLRVDTHDRVQPAVGDPRVAVWPDDHAVRRRAVAELRHPRRAGLRIEVAELAGALRRVPDASVDRGRDVVRPLTRADGELLHLRQRRDRTGVHARGHGRGRAGGRRGRSGRRRGSCAHHDAAVDGLAGRQERQGRGERGPHIRTVWQGIWALVRFATLFSVPPPYGGGST